MGEEHNYVIDKIINAGLYTMDGEKVLDLTDSAFTIDADIDSGADNGVDEIIQRFNSFFHYYNCKYTFILTLAHNESKTYDRIIYGWESKAPIRKRLIEKMYKNMAKLEAKKNEKEE